MEPELKDDMNRMLQEAGFRPSFVRFLNEGDTILIDRSFVLDPKPPVEMQVTELWVTQYDGCVRMSHWIGILTDGTAVHCTYGDAFPIWRNVRS